MNRSGRRANPAAAAARALLPALWLAAGVACAFGSGGQQEEAPLMLRLRVLSRMEHDPAAFTQGLVLADGELWESTGQYGASSLRRLDPSTGRVEETVELDSALFGEGLAAVKGELVQLTWQAERALVWNRASLQVVRSYAYEGEGWGLCFDGERLFMSDGSPVLQLRDPETFELVGRLPVTVGGRPVSQLNELECAEGWVYANILGSDRIGRIDPLDGTVRAVIDASGLLSESERQAAGVLNGIAYDEARATFLLTGKNWPRLFEVIWVE